MADLTLCVIRTVHITVSNSSDRNCCQRFKQDNYNGSVRNVTTVPSNGFPRSAIKVLLSVFLNTQNLFFLHRFPTSAINSAPLSLLNTQNLFFLLLKNNSNSNSGLLSQRQILLSSFPYSEYSSILRQIFSKKFVLVQALKFQLVKVLIN